MPAPSKAKSNSNNGRRFAPKPKPLTPQEAVPTLTFGPSNNWTDFSKKMAIAAGHSYGRLADIMDHGTYYIPPLPVADMSIVDSTMRDEVLKSDYRERSKILMRMETDKPMLYAFIVSKLSLESEDEFKRYRDYTNIHANKDPLSLWKALESLRMVTTVSKNAAFIREQAQRDYMTCSQGVRVYH